MEDRDLDLMRSKLQAWLSAQQPDWRDVTIGDIRFPSEGGNSAETSFLKVAYREEGRDQQRTLVVRRQLEGYDIFLDSELSLPFQMMKAVAEHSTVPVPPVFGIEFDRSILGSPFLVMEAVEGRVIPQSPNYNERGWLADLPPEKQKRVWLNAIEAMASINLLDGRDGFTFLDRPERGPAGLEQYLNALEIWYRWAANDRELPILEKGMAYLRDNQPADMPVCVLWGDSHASNILFGDDLAVTAVIDWEAAALGTPEVDFGYWLFFDELYSSGSGVERLKGLPGREEMTACYEKALGRPVRNLEYYEVLGAMRFSICLVRFADRMISLGLVPPDCKAGTQNPATHIMAAKLGVAAPGDLADFISMSVAAGRG